jgi:hypothetical protein
MTIYTDATNRYYLGDVLYGNHDILFSTVSYTKADKLSTGSINTDLDSIATSLGWGYRRTSFLSNWIQAQAVFEFSFPTEPTRARFVMTGVGATSFTVGGRADNQTYANTSPFDTGIFGYNSNFGEYAVLDPSGETSPIFERQVCGSFSDRSYSLFFIRRLAANPHVARYFFAHASFWQEGIIPNFTSDLGKCAVFCSGDNNGAPLAKGYHYDIANSTRKEILATGDAFYNIVCADLQTPGTEHNSGFYALYNDSLLYPMMGRYPDLLYGQGTYIIGKPVKLDGTVFPDLGHNHWLPVARWGTFTILMRCYSSLI